MPCVYHNHAVMAIHSCLASQHLQRLAKHKPYIFAGDFNIKPNDPSYHLLTNGYLSQHPRQTSSILETNDWKLQLNPMRSSYFAYLGQEPPYTNNTTIRKYERFCETLDYIFISHQWIVKNVLPVPELSSSTRVIPERSFPSEDEPSDHVMIGAELELVEDQTSKQFHSFLSKITTKFQKESSLVTSPSSS
jgi:mRNA deadenylase 3'-5' endonuclease subunit Ccr4